MGVKIIEDKELIEEYKLAVASLPVVTKENSTFEEWLEVVFKIYELGDLDQPMTACGGKCPWYERLLIPDEIMVSDYRNSLQIRSCLEKLYEDGNTPVDALILMF